VRDYRGVGTAIVSLGRGRVFSEKRDEGGEGKHLYVIATTKKG
jgi:hypothetical protein